jgi:thiol:disulfide interchange protein
MEHKASLFIHSALAALMCFPLSTASQQVQAQPTVAAPAVKARTSLSATKYDAKRDAASDLKSTIALAQRDGKNILIKVGGEWCPWCHIMDKFFDDNATIEQARLAGFVTLKVNYSPENKNEKFLSQFPKISGYPHLFVLDKNGKLLHSQDSDPLELGKSYDLKAMTNFIARWSPKTP